MITKRAFYALCVRNDDYRASLEPGKIYQVLKDEEADAHKQIRVVDESGEDYLYPRDYFRAIKVTKNWRGIFVPQAALWRPILKYAQSKRIVRRGKGQTAKARV